MPTVDPAARHLVTALLVIATFSGCGGSDQPIGSGSTKQTCRTPHFIGSGPPDWRRLSTHLGPFGLTPSRDHRYQTGPREPDGLFHVKTPALVEGHRPVELQVPPAERNRIGLEVVKPGGPYARVIFVPCQSKPRTIWGAGLVLRDRKPVTLGVRVGSAWIGAIRLSRIVRR